jgi:hypothetical protein
MKFGLLEQINNHLTTCLAGYYLCGNAVKIGRPHDKAELAEQVAQYSRVKGVGVGHSW